jgi:hypothetical protein
LQIPPRSAHDNSGSAAMRRLETDRRTDKA